MIDEVGSQSLGMEVGEEEEPGSAAVGGAKDGSGSAGGGAGDAGVGALLSEPGLEEAELSGTWTKVLTRRLLGLDPNPAASLSERRRGRADVGDLKSLEARLGQLEHFPPLVRTMVLECGKGRRTN